MTASEQSGLQLLADEKKENQMLGVFGLRSMGWSASAIASKWSKYIFKHVKYKYENRTGIEFGKDDFHFKITEEYSDDVYDVGASYIDENQVTRYRSTKGGWKVICLYTMDGVDHSYYIGVMRYGFHPVIIKKHFAKFLREYFKKSEL